MTISENYIQNTRAIFLNYKSLGEKALKQVEEKRLFWAFNNDSNSLAIIVQHLSGNMLSRFTAFFDEDGEKPWRNRDLEIRAGPFFQKRSARSMEKGWECFLDVLNNLNPEDLEKTVLIRNEVHTVLEAINRQLAHYSYHIGQIVFLSKMIASEEWKSLSIPKNKSQDFNDRMFGI